MRYLSHISLIGRVAAIWITSFLKSLDRGISGLKFRQYLFIGNISTNSKSLLNGRRTSNVWLPSMSCLLSVRTCFSITCLRLDENDGTSKIIAFQFVHLNLRSFETAQRPFEGFLWNSWPRQYSHNTHCWRNVFTSHNLTQLSFSKPNNDPIESVASNSSWIRKHANVLTVWAWQFIKRHRNPP